MSEDRSDPSAFIPVELRRLEEAMRARAGTSDPDRVRAARRLSELVKTEDADLGRFAKCYLGDRPIGAERLKELRELVIGVARLVSLQGTGEPASDLVSHLRGALLPRLDALEAEAAATQVKLQAAREAEKEAAREATRTAGVDASVLSANALRGFVGPDVGRAVAPPPPPPAPPPAPPPPAPPPPAFVQHETTEDELLVPQNVTAAALSARMSRPTLPFEAPKSSPPRFPLATNRSAASPPDDDDFLIPRNMTVAATPVSHPRPALPFAGAAAPPSTGRPAHERNAVVPSEPIVFGPPPSPAVPASPPARAPIAATPPEDDEELFISSHQTVPMGHPAGAASLPFTQEASTASQRFGPPAHLAHIDLEAHAAFVALLEVFPDREADVFARYGLRDRADREALDRHWFARIHEDPQLGEEWRACRDHAIAHYKSAR
ncbi:MAG: hypothetical protein U0414_02790 [Polyangiaceae bacterium]